MVSKLFFNIFRVLIIFLVSSNVYSAACEDVFPDALSNSHVNGEITINWAAFVINSPDNILDTNNLNDNSGFLVSSCVSVGCSASGSLAESGSFNSYPPGQPDVSLAYQESRTISPGNYNNLTMGGESVLTLEPGDYAFRGSFATGFQSEIIVSQPGTVRISGRSDLVFASENIINSAGGGRHILFYSRGDIEIGTSTNAKAFFYSRGDTTLNFLASVEGGITSRGDITLVSLASVTYDAAALVGIDMGDFCGTSVNVDHYSISHDGSGITCASETVSITPHDSAHTAGIDNGSAVVTLSTSTGEGAWAGVQAGTPANLSDPDPTDGTATYTFASGETSVSLYFNYPAVAEGITETFSINVTDGTYTETTGTALVSEDPSMTFANTGFRFVDESGGDFILPNMVAGDYNGNVSLQAVRTDTETGDCAGLFSNGATLAVELAGECENPWACAGVGFDVTNNSITTPITTEDSNFTAGASGYTSVNLLFGADSKASLGIEYDDVGQMQLHARREILLQDGSGSGEYMLGSSNVVVVSPYTMVVVDAEDSSAVNNPETTTGGIGFVAAGEAFRLVVEARDSEGDATPNYGNEASAEGVTVSIASLVYPSLGSSGSLSNEDSFSPTSGSGRFENTSISWNEVGAITLEPSVADGNYLGAGDISVLTESATIGRFYPDRFELGVGPAVTEACSGFSYFSQTELGVSYSLRAVNTGAVTVSNYGSGYTGTASLQYVAENNNNGTNLQSRVNITTPAWASGVLTVSDSAASLSRQASTTPEVPYTGVQFGLQIATELDSRDFASGAFNFNASATGDCVALTNCDAVSIGSAQSFRYGRLILKDAFGPETSDLPVSFQTEYWENNIWNLNTSDNCSAIMLSDISYPDGAIDIVGNRTATVGGGSTTGTYGDLSGSAANFTSGDAEHYFSAPSLGNTGAVLVDVDLTSYPWLRSDWDLDSDYSDSALPTATFTFGSYRGHDRVIFWQEVFN